MKIISANITGSLILNNVDISSITGSQTSINSLNSKTGSYATTGSNAFVGQQNINGSVAVTGSLTTTGTIVAQTLNVQQVTSSIVYSSGSNIFGNTVSNTQSMTGSVGITGSLSVNGVSTLSGALSGTSATFSSTNTATSFIPTSPTIPVNGMYLSAANTLDFATNSVNRLSISSAGLVIFSSSVSASYGGTFVIPIESPASGTVALVAKTSNGGNDIFRWYDGATQLGVFKNSGNVGIGTASPSALLNTYSATTATQIIVTGADTTNQRLEVTDGTVTNRFGIFGRTNGDAGVIGTQTNHPLVFNTNGTESMRIKSGGEVYIAGTTDQGAYNLQCNGTGVWGAGAYVNGSDLRLKEDIKPILSGLDYVNKMNPVSFKYLESYSRDRSIQTGFIAQELIEVFKDEEWVDGIVKQGTEHYNVAYQAIIPVLVKAIQELKAEIDLLKGIAPIEPNNNLE